MNPQRPLPDWLPPLLLLALMVIAFTFLAGDGAAPIVPIPTPTPTPGLQQTALDSQAAGELGAAAEAWRALLAEDPQNAQAHYQLGLFLALSNLDDAAWHLEQAAAIDPAYQPNAVRLTNTLRLAAFTEDPAYQAIQVGQALASIGEWALAKNAFQASIERSPTYAEAWAYYAEALYQTGEESLPYLEHALALNPDSLTANIFTGLYYQRQGQPELSLVYYQQAAELEPGNLYLQLDIAYALAEIGNYNSGFEHIQRILEANPDNLNAWIMVAEFALHYGYQIEDVGLPAARQAVILDNSNPQALTLLARAYSIQGDFLVAERFFKLALQSDPNYLPAHYYLGFHYLAHDRAQPAQQHFQTVLTLDPNHPLALEAQNFLDTYFP